MMKRIEYGMPALTNSTKEIKVKDHTGEEVFTLKKYYNNNFQKFLSILMPGFVSNVLVKKHGKLVAKSKDIFTLGRPKWDIYDHQHKNDEAIRLQDIRVVRTHPKAKFSIGSDNYKIERVFGSKTTTVIKNGNKIVEMKFDKSLPPRNMEIHFIEENNYVPLLLCILHTYELSS
ncbi:tubby C-terminal domain-like protein [Evansella halocellulosilytica]|uniref:tubby C-terminal domain-like protein n=1 Tax=Evansella halocellulosilytica TaxID=2011013 RepID=UPI001155C59F|nr:hypothetical protein [Evansella halocellulosilytica]